uniref:Reverse transcriptase Ty1/copia-type domain-containing protein n=1 Tax=Tanacetum cinerariifolium TaxID=118510 RepID=A0A6L2LLT3_TANCI|nr:hypothetical protein [Tanacetum cinerariifolium]
MTTSSANNSVFRSFFKKQKLSGPNFIDWYRQLMIVLSIEDKLNYLEQPIPPDPIAPEGQQVAPEIIAAHTAWIKGSKEISGLMLMTIEPEIQRNLENLHAHEMLLELKTLFAQQAEAFGVPVTLSLEVSLILISLRKEFDGFVQNYNMHNMEKTINELHAMLKLHEQTLPKKTHLLFMLYERLRSRKATNSTRNCNLNRLLRDKIKGRGKISLLMLPSLRFLLYPRGKILLRTPSVINARIHAIGRGTVYDTGCGTHICNTTQGLRGSRKLKPFTLSLYVGNGQRAAVEAIGSYHLSLPSGLVIVLNNFHYAPSITRGIISVSRLYNDGYVNQFVDYLIQVSRNSMVYFSVVSWDGIFEINLSDSYTNVSSIYALRNKRSKSNLDSLMALSSYIHQVERSKDLLRLIHTDVCGPFKIVSRQEASYFVTFTDDSSRYGYVYLLKHKHDVFETSKVFQKEVENQLGSWDYRPSYASLHAIIEWSVGEEKQNSTRYENSLITQEASGSLEDLEIIQEEDTHPSIDTSLNHNDDDLEIDEPQSDIIPIRRSIRTRHAPDHMCLYIDAEEHELGDLGEPANNEAALLNLESDKWLNAMNVKMQSMKDNIRAIRILIAIAAFYDYEIWQMDVKTAFLNGYLFEEVYMEQPEGFVNPKYPNQVCKLKQWNKRFDDEIKKFCFIQNHDEPCVHLKASGSNITFLILYVDDILIMGNHIPMLRDVKSYLGRSFAMKDLGEAAYILGIKIYSDRSWRLIGLCQSAYIEKVLKIYHMENSKRESILMKYKIRLSKSQGASTPVELKRMQNVPYASAVGSIMYAVRCTRPDVVFAQNITSQFQPNLGDLYWTTVKNILKYLRITKDMFLIYRGDIKRELRRCVDWKSVKQSIFATSSAEAEYIAAFDASKEAVWVRKFIFGLGVVPTIEDPISMYCDNTGAITIANESGITKDDNLADAFSKALAFPKHPEHTKNIGMLPAIIKTIIGSDVKQHSQLGLTSNTTSEDDAGAAGEISNRETSSLMTKIYGRDEEKKMIVDNICNQDIGFAHGDVDVRGWVYVSAVFDVRQIINQIVEAIYGPGVLMLDYKSLDAMQGELCKALSCEEKSSMVMVTTRKEDTAQLMAKIPELQYNVGVLLEKESWSLFEMLAFPGRGEGGNVSSEMELVGREIVEKCKGLPLVVQTLGEEMIKDLLIELWIANEFIPSQGDVSLYVLGILALHPMTYNPTSKLLDRISLQLFD